MVNTRANDVPIIGSCATDCIGVLIGCGGRPSVQALVVVKHFVAVDRDNR